MATPTPSPTPSSPTPAPRPGCRRSIRCCWRGSSKSSASTRHASAWVLFAHPVGVLRGHRAGDWEIAARCFSRRVALWSAWIWALYPAAMQYAVRWPWEMTITTALFTFTLVLALRHARRRRCSTVLEPSQPLNLEPRSGSLRLAVGTDRAVESNAADFSAGLRRLDSPPAARTWPSATCLAIDLQRPLLAALIFLACVAPWTARNFAASTPSFPCAATSARNSTWATAPAPTAC